MITSKPITVAIGLSLCGVTCYLIYRIFKKDEDDDYNDNVTKSRNFKTLEIRIPKDLVKELIGRNGKNIKNIQEVSGTRMNFKDDGAGSICVVRGSIEACHIGKNLVQEFIDNHPVLETEIVCVSRISLGKIIGRGGENISEMQSLSGAKIKVDDDTNSTYGQVSIKGTKEQIVIAKSLVMSLVENLKESYLKLETTLAKREPRLPPKLSPSNANPETTVSSESPKRRLASPLIGQPDAPFEVYVSAIVDPTRFWIQIVGPKASELDRLVEEMTLYYGKIENQNVHGLECINKGDLVAAVFQYDKKWYRAEVLKIIKNPSAANEDTAELYFVDYGDTDIVPVRDVYELRTDFLQLHFQAIECYLAKIEPIGPTWSSDAVDKFEDWTHVAQWRKLSAKINGYCVREKTRAKREGSPIPGVDLYDVNDDQEMDIAQELVNNGYAVYKKDSLISSSLNNSVSSGSITSSSVVE